jgi:hypothetical protein
VSDTSPLANVRAQVDAALDAAGQAITAAATPRPARPPRQAPARPRRVRKRRAGKVAPPIKHLAKRAATGPKVYIDFARGQKRIAQPEAATP